MAIMEIIQQQQHKLGNFDEGFLIDGKPWDKTILQINIYHKPEYLIRYQDKLWKGYKSLLNLLEKNPELQKQQEKVYHQLCYGLAPKLTAADVLKDNMNE
jgi:hypothetical protein